MMQLEQLKIRGRLMCTVSDVVNNFKRIGFRVVQQVYTTCIVLYYSVILRSKFDKTQFLRIF